MHITSPLSCQSRDVCARRRFNFPHLLPRHLPILSPPPSVSFGKFCLCFSLPKESERMNHQHPRGYFDPKATRTRRTNEGRTVLPTSTPPPPPSHCPSPNRHPPSQPAARSCSHNKESSGWPNRIIQFIIQYNLIWLYLMAHPPPQHSVNELIIATPAVGAL